MPRIWLRTLVVLAVFTETNVIYFHVIDNVHPDNLVFQALFGDSASAVVCYTSYEILLVLRTESIFGTKLMKNKPRNTMRDEQLILLG